MIVVKQTKSLLNKIIPDAVNPLSGTDSTTTKTNPNIISRNRGYLSSHHANNDLLRSGSIGRKNSTNKLKSRSSRHQRSPSPLGADATADATATAAATTAYAKSKTIDDETRPHGQKEVAIQSKNNNFNKQELNSLEWVLICIIVLLIFIMYMIT